MVQLDRLLIPRLLPLGDLATFGVLAALVGSPFRVFCNSVGYSLLPRLSVARSIAERRRLVLREAWLAGLLVVIASAAVWVVVPWVERSFLAGKYDLPPVLVLSQYGPARLAKILNAFGKVIPTALADARELSLMDRTGMGLGCGGRGGGDGGHHNRDPVQSIDESIARIGEGIAVAFEGVQDLRGAADVLHAELGDARAAAGRADRQGAARHVRRPPVNVQSWYGLIIVSVLGATAAQYLLLLGPFRALNPALEEASLVCGASRLRSVFQIEIPALGPRSSA